MCGGVWEGIFHFPLSIFNLSRKNIQLATVIIDIIPHTPMHMRRTLLFTGFLGIISGYLLGRKELREDLMEAKNSSEAARVIGEHLSEDTSQLADDVRTFMKSEKMHRKWGVMKRTLANRFKRAKKETRSMARTAQRRANDLKEKAADRAGMQGGTTM